MLLGYFLDLNTDLFKFELLHQRFKTHLAILDLNIFLYLKLRLRVRIRSIQYLKILELFLRYFNYLYLVFNCCVSYIFMIILCLLDQIVLFVFLNYLFISFMNSLDFIQLKTEITLNFGRFR